MLGLRTTAAPTLSKNLLAVYKITICWWN